MNLYKLLRPLLFRLDAESAHHLGMRAARWGGTVAGPLVSSTFKVSDQTLEQNVLGLSFKNPVGLAAGFDKNGRHIPFWPKMGFGFCEIGSVTARPSSGNPRPRAFRLPSDEAIINRMGLNNEGATEIAKRLQNQSEQTVPLGVNIAKTHDPAIMGEDAVADFVESFGLLARLADYVTLNVSCPNTREGKTFEDPEALHGLLDAIFDKRSEMNLDVPVLVKLSPPGVTESVAHDPMESYRSILDVCAGFPVAGFVATNTASDRHGLSAPREEIDRIGAGGLSGKPLAKRSTSLISFLYRTLNGSAPIIGVGGIDSAESAYQKIRAGASLVQIYTGLVYQGPGLVKKINKGLVNLIDRDGFSSLTEAVGIDSVPGS